MGEGYYISRRARICFDPVNTFRERKGGRCRFTQRAQCLPRKKQGEDAVISIVRLFDRDVVGLNLAAVFNRSPPDRSRKIPLTERREKAKPCAAWSGCRVVHTKKRCGGRVLFCSAAVGSARFSQARHGACSAALSSAPVVSSASTAVRLGACRARIGEGVQLHLIEHAVRRQWCWRLCIAILAGWSVANNLPCFAAQEGVANGLHHGLLRLELLVPGKGAVRLVKVVHPGLSRITRSFDRPPGDEDVIIIRLLDVGTTPRSSTCRPLSAGPYEKQLLACGRSSESMPLAPSPPPLFLSLSRTHQLCRSVKPHRVNPSNDSSERHAPSTSP